jgi:hypothetical protein
MQPNIHIDSVNITFARLLNVLCKEKLRMFIVPPIKPIRPWISQVEAISLKMILSLPSLCHAFYKQRSSLLKTLRTS